ncbi:GNAT family N-acetyltransferase [Streptococcus suis]|uniref:GCN5-related N-acetyltransferase n=1 Tax=Streptococcus suis D12 TaxID=1004952 RepID=G7SI91_STRSU|nr:GNAT family N-acetyltransferase [Streptococcus suis]AER19818.1 GCN5-related N-acetyltransferase [Streptococcus suis D12]MCK4023754.1 GNAT family N-acetyltransferase [Streptococcus suis]HEM3122429.1 GNAT family N-acetyltransferase [Streptococcus suis]HEM3571304.1 GNAT family N-acetyltransferase [Streptococcus suis]HEM5125086.1 GNAT family N-acetyltransferase [Streptococcus suis]
MILETNRLLLRPWSESDAADLFSQASHPDVGPAAGWPVHQSVEESREIIKTVLSQPETYALVLKETGQVIGSIGLMLGKQGGLDLPDSEAEIGYWIGHSFWGQVLVPEASQVLLDYGFSQLNLEKVWYRAFVENSKSLRVQEKLGFVYQYLLEDVYFSLIDEIRTERVSLLTREEWQSRKEKP